MLPWHRPIFTTLSTSFHGGRFHHAHLFYGLPGVGKQQLVDVLSNTLLCAKLKSFSACGQCKGCTLNFAQTHPDKMTIDGDGTSISVDSIRELNQFLCQSAGQNGNKVAIINNAEKMTTAAANALLKTLEEPNEHRFILLASNDLSRLPATVLSRCNKNKVSITNKDEVRDYLMAKKPEILNYAWAEYFIEQPVQLEHWYGSELLDKIDTLYQFASAINTGHNFKGCESILSDHPVLTSVFCLFMQLQFKKWLLNGLSFEQYQSAQNVFREYTVSLQTVLGLNQNLALSKLAFSLKKILK